MEAVERRVMGNDHARCGTGEKLEDFIHLEVYLSLLGKIPNFDKVLAVIRSREISAMIILQSLSQLKATYKEQADTIVGNCDSLVFLGGQDIATLKEVNQLLGKRTIDMVQKGESRGQSRSYNTTYQTLGRDLITIDEMATMSNEKCIVKIRGVNPFFSNKFSLEKHERYHYLAEASPLFTNTFQLNDYLNKKKEEESDGIFYGRS